MDRRTLLGAAAATLPLAGCIERIQETVSEDVAENEDGVLRDVNLEPDDRPDQEVFDQIDELVSVGPDSPLEFEPNDLEIDPGTVVGFEWESFGHAIVVGDLPEEGAWAGVPVAQEEGYLHVHTFEAEGLYTYYCGPHATSDSPETHGRILVGLEKDDLSQERRDDTRPAQEPQNPRDEDVYENDTDEDGGNETA